MLKYSVENAYNAGDELTYTLNFVNTADYPFNDLTITDDLGTYNVTPTLTATPLTYIDGSISWFKDGVRQLTPLTVAQTGNQITITGATVSEEGQGTGNTTIIYKARVNEFASPLPQGSITNTVSAQSTLLSAPVTSSDTIPQNDTINLSISKSVAPATVPENGTLTYTITIENYGSRATNTGDNVVFSDTFTPVLNNIEVSLNGQALPTTSYTYAGGNFATNPDVITVPAATFNQDPATGEYLTTPGTSVLVISGTI